MVACVESQAPQPPRWPSSQATPERMAPSCSPPGDALTSASTASAVVSTVSASLPERVMLSAAPGKLPSLACMPTRRRTTAAVVPAPGSTSSRVLAASATR